MVPPLALAPLCALVALVPLLRSGAMGGWREAAAVYVGWVVVTLPLLVLARGALVALREAQRAFAFLFVAPTMPAAVLAFALAAVLSQPLGAWIHAHTHQRALGAVTWTVATGVVALGTYPVCRRLACTWPRIVGGLAFVGAVTLVLRGALRDAAWLHAGVLVAGALVWDVPPLRRDGPLTRVRMAALCLGGTLAVLGAVFWWAPLEAVQLQGLQEGRVGAAKLLRSLLPLACAPLR